MGTIDKFRAVFGDMAFRSVHHDVARLDAARAPLAVRPRKGGPRTGPSRTERGDRHKLGSHVDLPRWSVSPSQRRDRPCVGSSPTLPRGWGLRRLLAEPLQNPGSPYAAAQLHRLSGRQAPLMSLTCRAGTVPFAPAEAAHSFEPLDRPEQPPRPIRTTEPIRRNSGDLASPLRGRGRR
jgi:hypothetical protein